MEFKPIWDGLDWQLLVNDKDEFKIYDKMTGDSILIESDDKDEIQKLMGVLTNELWEESVDFSDDD